MCAHVCQLYSLSFKRHPFLAVTCVMSALLVQGVNGVRGADEARIPFCNTHQTTFECSV